MIHLMTSDQKAFLAALHHLAQEGKTVVTLHTLGARLGWEYKRFMEISDSLLAIQRILVTPLGISLSGFGASEAKQIVEP